MSKEKPPHKEPGYDHEYQPGNIVIVHTLKYSGDGVITGVRFHFGQLYYWIKPYNRIEEFQVWPKEILGYCIAKYPGQESIPGLEVKK